MEREIMREFLTRLGFVVDEPSFRKFITRNEAARKSSLAVGASILGIGTAAFAAATAYARSMEEIYYRSRRTGAAAANLKALEFGFGQIGLRAEDANAAVEALAANARTNPGINALIRKFVGGETDPTKQLIALVTALKRMPYPVAALWAQQFGIPENVYQMLQAPGALEKLKAAGDDARDTFRRMNVDQEEAARVSQEYMNTLRKLWMEADVVASKFLINLLPAFQRAAGGVSEYLDQMSRVNFDELEVDLPKIAGFLLEVAGGWRGVAQGIADATKKSTDFVTGKDFSDRMWTEYGKVMAFVMGGPNWWRGGRREDLFPPGTPGADAAGKPTTRAPAPPPKLGQFGSSDVGVNAAGHPYETDEARLTARMRQLEILREELAAARDPAVRADLQRELDNIGKITERLKPNPAGPGPVSSAGSNVTIRQENNYAISGTDPQGVARSVAGVHGRTSRELADLFRNSQPAVV